MLFAIIWCWFRLMMTAQAFLLHIARLLSLLMPPFDASSYFLSCQSAFSPAIAAFDSFSSDDWCFSFATLLIFFAWFSPFRRHASPLCHFRAIADAFVTPPCSQHIFAATLSPFSPICRALMLLHFADYLPLSRRHAYADASFCCHDYFALWFHFDASIISLPIIFAAAIGGISNAIFFSLLDADYFRRFRHFIFDATLIIIFFCCHVADMFWYFWCLIFIDAAIADFSSTAADADDCWFIRLYLLIIDIPMLRFHYVTLYYDAMVIFDALLRHDACFRFSTLCYCFFMPPWCHFFHYYFADADTDFALDYFLIFVATPCWLFRWLFSRLDWCCFAHFFFDFLRFRAFDFRCRFLISLSLSPASMFHAAAFRCRRLSSPLISFFADCLRLFLSSIIFFAAAHDWCWFRYALMLISLICRLLSLLLDDFSSLSAFSMLQFAACFRCHFADDFRQLDDYFRCFRDYFILFISAISTLLPFRFIIFFARIFLRDIFFHFLVSVDAEVMLMAARSRRWWCRAWDYARWRWRAGGNGARAATV